MINQVVGATVEWMRARIRQNPESGRPKATLMILYEDDKGVTSEVIELRSADAEPVRRLPEEFERYTRTKPPEA